MSLVQEIIVELFRTRSFINIWYLILLAVSWSMATYRTLGVGHNEAHLAQRVGGTHMDEFNLVAENYCARLTGNFERYGAIIVLTVCFGMASLATLGFVFWYLFAQALFLLLFPLMLAGCVTLVFAYVQVRNPMNGADLIKRYNLLRRLKQLIGVLTISGVTMWGTIVTFKLPLA